MEKKEVQHQVHLEATVKLLDSDLAEEATRAGLDNHLQRWIEDVKAADNPELHQVVVDLQALKALLGSGTYDGDQVGRLLHRLATESARVAHFAEGNTEPRVRKLAAALLAASGQLQGPATTPEEDLRNNNRGVDRQA